MADIRAAHLEQESSANDVLPEAVSPGDTKFVVRASFLPVISPNRRLAYVGKDFKDYLQHKPAQLN